jgi:ferredoxin
MWRIIVEKIKRVIVRIDATRCDGCGICVESCAEGAIRMVDGKAQLVSDHYCDGLGDCLQTCSAGAITLETRLADAFDAKAAEEHVAAMKSQTDEKPLPCGCPGSMSRELQPSQSPCCGGEDEDECGCETASAVSRLKNWPVQLALVPPSAPYLREANLLLVADCVPVAMPDFHDRFLKTGPVIIACPKLDANEPQVDKLATILRTACPTSLTVLRMEVPCCKGLVRVAEEALRKADSHTPLQEHVIKIDGQVE